MSVLKNIPFLRICIPFIAGILLSIQFDLQFNKVLSIAPILVAFAVNLIRKQTVSSRRIFLISIDVFLFSFAVILANESKLNRDKYFYANTVKPDSLNTFIVQVNDLPVASGNYIKCGLKVIGVKAGSNYQIAEGKLLAYFKGGKNIGYGQTLLIATKLSEIGPPKNPFEFDYKKYLGNKQVYHTAFIEDHSFALIDSQRVTIDILSLGLKARQFILQRLKNSELSQEAYAICAALLTGYDDDIEKPVMDAFSHSGTLHVLSVSGLHTGLIYLVLAFIFDLFDRKKKYRFLKFAFVTFILWWFALITGFSAPVLRAVIMFNLLGIGKIFFRNNYRNQINILFVSAFILLCYDPFLITDIGFQLSYTAMFGLLFFQPAISGVWSPQNWFLNYTWQSVCASFAATLSTLPLTLFYFKQFPVWFFICNLVVVPATFVVLLLAVLVVLNVSKTAVLINFVIKFLIGFIYLFNSASIGFVDNVDFRLFDALALALVILLFSSAFYYRSYRYLVYSFVIMIFWQTGDLFFSWNSKNQQLFTAYQIKKSAAYCVKNKQETWISSEAEDQFDFHIKPHLISFNYSAINRKNFNFIQDSNEKILILNKKNFWPQADFSAITTIVISNHFKLTGDDLLKFGNLKTLIVDGSNNIYETRKLAELCSKFVIQFYSTKANGAYVKNLEFET